MLSCFQLGLRGRGPGGSKNDPAGRDVRRVSMMARVSLAEGYPARSALSLACCLQLSMRRMEPSGPDDLSEQTRWMIAVRDTGDRAAYARLFDFYAPRVKALAMRGGTPAGAAEDIAQDVMLRVWQSRFQFDPSRAQVSGWILPDCAQPPNRRCAAGATGPARRHRRRARPGGSGCRARARAGGVATARCVAGAAGGTARDGRASLLRRADAPGD